MIRAIVAGPDEDGLGSELADRGAELTRIDGVVDADRLREAGIEEAALFVLTDLDEATAVAVAKDLNPEVRVVAYSDGTLPEYAKGQADLSVDPSLLGPEVVAEELLGLGDE